MRCFFSLVLLLASTPVLAQESVDQDPASLSIKKLILPGEAFRIEGRPAFILWPANELRRTPQPWIMYGPTLPGYPDAHEKWMHEKFLAGGVAVAGIDVDEAYGSPRSQTLFTALYRELTTKRGFAAKPCLLGRSRGGLWVTSWAAANPDKVAGIAGIYPVFDLRTYPGLEKAAPAYGVTPAELQDRLSELNPIERIGGLIKARVPVCIIHGDDDKVVPLKENSAELLARYEAAGAKDSVQLIIARGQGHNFWEGFFRCQELIDFAIAKLKARSATFFVRGSVLRLSRVFRLNSAVFPRVCRLADRTRGGRSYRFRGVG